jgi:ABC-2 type transport system permease protein
MSPTYLRLEIVRTLRNRRFLIFSLGFPLVLLLAFAGPNEHRKLEGIPFPLYYMAGMAAWGTMTAVISGGARISAERSLGWTRQMRITPLPVRSYFAAKVLCSYLMAIVSLAVLFVAGSTVGVQLSADRWFTMVVLILIGLVPFVIIGIALGHLLTVDSMGPALGGVTTLFALLGGAWGQLSQSPGFVDAVKLLPSYWLVEASHAALGGGWWPAEGWIVLAVWSVALAALATRIYQRDTARI